METAEIARRLVELFREGKNAEAHDELFAQDALNIEMDALSEGPMGTVTGLPAIHEKGRLFGELVEALHSKDVSDPVVAGNWFSVAATMDWTLKGRGRTTMREICVYHVRDGKIVSEQFFYDT